MMYMYLENCSHAEFSKLVGLDCQKYVCFCVFSVFRRS